MCSDGGGSNPALVVRAVSKCYHLYDRSADRLWQIFLRGRKQLYREFWALRDVSFEVEKGQSLGIVGANGAGKSTLLQILVGTVAPTTGEVAVRGRVAALLELGSGFNPEFTGRENVFMNAAVLGLSLEETRRRYDDIVAFADIGEFINQPIQTYSTGMVVRLAFAVAVHVDADILVVDEALAVGDAAFQAKCYRRIDALRERGVTIFLATHDTNAMAQYCDRGLLLDCGRVVLLDDARAVAEEYYRRVHRTHRREALAAEAEAAATAAAPVAAAGLEAPSQTTGSRLGDGRAEVVRVGVFNARGEATRALRVRETARVDLAVRFCAALDDPHVGACLRDVQNRILVGGHTLYEGQRLGPVGAGEEVTVSIEFPVLVNPGKYLLTFGVAEHVGAEEWRDCDVWFDYCEIDVYGEARAWGEVNTPARISVRRGAAT